MIKMGEIKRSKNELTKGYFNSLYVGDWADMYFRHLSKFIVKFISKLKWVTPNFITVFSSFIFIVGCLMLFINIPYHLYYAAILIFIGYIGDLLDGDLARERNISSNFGGYLDVLFDVVKVYFIIISLSIAVYLNTNNILYIFLGFTACAAILCKFYLKQYVIKFTPTYERIKIANELKQKIEIEYEILSKTFIGKLKIIWLKNKNIFNLDEAEAAVFTSLACVFNQLTIWFWIFTLTQVIIFLIRAFQRGNDMKEIDIKYLKKRYGG